MSMSFMIEISLWKSPLGNQGSSQRARVLESLEMMQKTLIFLLRCGDTIF